MPAFCLSIHARYQCRHAGKCCQKWTVSAEPEVVRLVEQRGLRRRDVDGPLFVSSRKPDSDGAVDVARDKNGNCVFFDQDTGRLCLIHRDSGADALPSACRHFPRKFLRDSRGTFVSLSHFCPTAANLLNGNEPLEAVDAAPPLLIAEPIEGLDARDALPPLLRPGVLCDMDGYAAWEREGVAVLGRKDMTWSEALGRIAAATDRVRAWTPDEGALAACVGEAFQDESADARPLTPHDQDLVAIVSRLAGSRAGGGPRPIADFARLWNDRVGRAFDRHDAAMKNFLAARLFANWIAYQGRGLRSIVHWLGTAAALVRHYMLDRVLDSRHEPAPDDFIEAIRTTDLLLLHVIDTQAFAHAVAPLA